MIATLLYDRRPSRKRLKGYPPRVNDAVGLEPLIKRIEINYRGIFQKNLAKRIGSDIVYVAHSAGKTGFSNGRYSDAPERNGIPCKYFAFVTHDLAEEELEAEAGAKLDIDECDLSVVLY